MAKLISSFLTKDILDRFKLAEDEKNIRAEGKEDITDILTLSKISAHKVFLVGEEPIFIIGIRPFWNHVGDVWIYPSIHMYKYRHSIIRTCLFYIQAIEERRIDHKYERLQSICIDDAKHNKFMKVLGFKREGRFKKFYPDKTNACMWARMIE